MYIPVVAFPLLVLISHQHAEMCCCPLAHARDEVKIVNCSDFKVSKKMRLTGIGGHIRPLETTDTLPVQIVLCKHEKHVGSPSK